MLKHSTFALLVLAACGGGKPAATGPTPEARAREEAWLNAPPPPLETKPKAPSAGDTFLAECRQTLAKGKARVEAVRAVAPPRTVENTLDVYDDGNRDILNAALMSALAQEVNPDKSVREAAQVCELEVQQVTTDLSLDRGLYDALKAVDVTKADPDTQRYQRNTLRDFRRAGVDLADDKRARLKSIDDEITKLGQQHAENIAADTRYIEVTDKARLAGMPADWVSEHKPQPNGAIRVTTDYPDYNPFMSYATDDGLRKELYVQYQSRAGDKNEPLLQKILLLRAEKAKMLGFADWADYQSDDKMLRGGKAATAFIDRVAKLAKARGTKDYQELLAQLKKTDPKATSVGAWQKTFLAEQVKKTSYAIDSAEVRQYFTYDKVLTGLLALTSVIYDIRYVDAKDAKPWHRSVTVFDVMRGDTTLGRVYLDMHPRENKYKHAAMFPIKLGIEGKQLPEGALVCNFPTSLMDHDDVVTMFHEFGHLMHHVLGGQQRWTTQSGVANELDFVEAPSQMFEEWAWDYQTLSTFAKHSETGATIPKELVAKMGKARTFGRGTDTLQQMFYAALALRYHQADPAKLDQLAVLKELQAKYTPFAYVEGTKFHSAFGHLVGYSSMYYTYMWSLVIARDLLTPFAKEGLLYGKAPRQYRDKVLVPGGTKDAADLVKDFLGRPYDFKAFEKYLKN